MKPKKVTKAVFPVAGMGTRFLPATKSIPKEIMTLVDRPLIQYAIDEARAAGIKEFIFVTSRGKSARGPFPWIRSDRLFRYGHGNPRRPVGQLAQCAGSCAGSLSAPSSFGGGGKYRQDDAGRDLGRTAFKRSDS